MTEKNERSFFEKYWKLLAGAALLAAFLVLIVLLKTVDVAVDENAGKEIGLSSVNFAVRDAVGVHLRFYDLTQYIGYFAILSAAGFAVWAVVRFFLSRFDLRKTGIDFLVLGGLYLAVILFYVFFEIVIVNYRPVLIDGTTPEASFPSTHTVLSIVIFLSASRLLHRRFALHVNYPLFSLPFCALAVFTVVARFVSGVHWLTDIVGGVLLSAALLFLFSFFSDLVPVETDDEKEAPDVPAEN